MGELLDKMGFLLTTTVVRYFVIAGIPFFIVYKLLYKRLRPNKIQERHAANKHFIREIGYSLSTSVIFAFVSGIMLFSPVSKYTLVYHHIHDYPVWWIPVSFVISMVIHDTYFYWMHRGLHHKKIFRIAHLVHHKSTNPSPWSAYSFHIIESFTEAGILVVLFFTLPMHPIAILLFIVVGLMINVYGHLGYEIAPRWLRHTWLFEVVNTSVHHNLHHSKFKGNYGLYYRVWDRICGTEHPDYVKEYDRVQEQRFGARRKNIEKNKNLTLSDQKITISSTR